MEGTREESNDFGNNQKQNNNSEDYFICSFPLSSRVKNNDNFCTPSEREPIKKKHIKNRSMDYQSDLSINILSKMNPMSSSDKRYQPLNISGEQLLSNSVVLNYEEVTQTKKEMKSYLKKVKAFHNRISALKKQETDLSNRMLTMRRKQQTIEKIKKSNKKIKDILNKTKSKLVQDQESKKEQVMLKKISEQDKADRHKREFQLKKMKCSESCKAKQTLVKCMISQSHTKTETLNKYKYIQAKENRIQYKTEEYYKQKEREENKKNLIIKKITEDKDTITSLKDQCCLLEKVEEECFERLKTTKMKTNYFQYQIDPSYYIRIKNKNKKTNDGNYTIHVNVNKSANDSMIKSKDKDDDRDKCFDEDICTGNGRDDTRDKYSEKSDIKDKDTKEQTNLSLNKQEDKRSNNSKKNNNKITGKERLNSVEEQSIKPCNNIECIKSSSKPKTKTFNNKNNSAHSIPHKLVLNNQRKNINGINPFNNLEMKYSTIV